ESTLVPPSENFHLLMQYDESGFQLPADRPKWGTGRLIPRGLTPQNRRYAAMVMPLTLAQNRFGFLWIEMNTREWDVFVRIRNLLSSALLRTMLVEQRSLVQRQVEHLLDESQLRAQELVVANEKAQKAAEENARLYNQEQQRRKNAEALSKVIHNLSALLKLEELPAQILEQLEGLIPFERGLVLIDEPDGSTRVAAEKGFPREVSGDDLLSLVDAGGAYDLVMEKGGPVIMDAVTSISDGRSLPGDHSWICIPLFSKNNLTGLLALTRQGTAEFSQDELLLATMFGLQAAISIENARLYDGMARFNELLERMVSQRVEELNNAYNKLEKLDKFKTSFIEVTAHELRTPITVMKGYLSMLKEYPAISENNDLLTAVKGVLIGTERLHQIVNSMLDLARLEAHALTPHLETVILGLVFRRIQNEYQADLAARNIALVYEEGVSNLPFLRADPQLLQKALDALVVNAIKFTPDGGSLSLGGQAVTDDELGACLEIRVRDTGIGIDPANQQVIFEKLFQLGKVELHSSGRTKFKGGGPGLGLAIATSIVKAHHGRIWVESPGYDEENCPGSTFFIRLPLPDNS
ncbi:MAG TPA: ATP-binding protein, partial [Anaerolineales bacterium]